MIAFVLISIILVILIVLAYFAIQKLKYTKTLVLAEVDKINDQYIERERALKVIEDNITEKRTDLEQLNEQIEDNKIDYQKALENLSVINGQISGAEKQLESLNDISIKNKQQISDAQEQKQQILENIDKKFQNDLKQLIETYQDKSEKYEEELNDLREKRNAAIQIAINEYETVNQRKFYMLDLSQNDIEDMKVLKQFEPILHNKEILGKLIYKTYVEKPYTSLIGRVLEKQSFSGIYKITNELNQMCYIGQAVDIKKRWQTHLKRAVGAEGMVNNKLYPAMQEFGIENFSFEVIDKCSKDKLNEREQYWQKFYQAKSFGYSIK